jgi:prevent-host-death family protein
MVTVFYHVLHMKRVGVRELKQNASEVLRRVKEGEAFEVTERGTPVALLVPLPISDSIVDRLVAAGRARPARGNLTTLPPPLADETGGPLPSEVLADLRSMER